MSVQEYIVKRFLSPLLKQSSSIEITVNINQHNKTSHPRESLMFTGSKRHNRSHHVSKSFRVAKWAKQEDSDGLLIYALRTTRMCTGVRRAGVKQWLVGDLGAKILDAYRSINWSQSLYSCLWSEVPVMVKGTDTEDTAWPSKAIISYA